MKAFFELVDVLIEKGYTLDESMELIQRCIAECTVERFVHFRRMIKELDAECQKEEEKLVS